MILKYRKDNIKIDYHGINYGKKNMLFFHVKYITISIKHIICSLNGIRNQISISIYMYIGVKKVYICRCICMYTL